MEDLPSSVSSDDTWADEFARTLGEQRGRVEEFLAGQRERLDRAHAELAEQIERISEASDQDRTETVRARKELEQQSDDLNRQGAALARFKEELEARQADWDEVQQRAIQNYETLSAQIRHQQDELSARQEELQGQRDRIDADEATLRHDQRAFALERQEHQAEVEHVAAMRQRLEERIAELTAEREQLATGRAHTEAQRRRIAQEFRAQRAAHLKELERRRAELDQRDTGQSDQARQEREQLQRRADEAESLRHECDQLRKQLAERSRQAENEGADDDLRQRYEMAVEDIRAAKARNAELQAELERARADGARAAVASSDVTLNWEDEKRRILAALEADSDEDDEQHAAERLKIEDVVQQTDQAMAEKDREIGELKALLGDQSSNLGSVAVGAAALGEMLDQDAIIREERESLRRLQAEWEEKLRKAEIDISIERAKIARDQAQLEERLRAFEEKGDQPEADSGTSDKSGGPAKPARGRWLARLGLKDLEDG